MSVGGNDAGFSSVLTECAQPGWMSDCDGSINTAQSFINNTLPGRLSTLYASIKSKAPNAVVVVVGYPRVFMGEDCNAATFFSPAEETRLNATADLLNSKALRRCQRQGLQVGQPHVAVHRARRLRQHRVAQRLLEPGQREPTTPTGSATPPATSRWSRGCSSASTPGFPRTPLVELLA
nr:hypothetical protein [Nocardioides convexus]